MFPLNALAEAIRTDTEFVKEFRLETARETLKLDYPSYILALAIGARKTVLIGAIHATESAMAQEYPDNGFVGNARCSPASILRSPKWRIAQHVGAGRRRGWGRVGDGWVRRPGSSEAGAG